MKLISSNPLIFLTSCRHVKDTIHSVYVSMADHRVPDDQPLNDRPLTCQPMSDGSPLDFGVRKMLFMAFNWSSSGLGCTGDEFHFSVKKFSDEQRLTRWHDDDKKCHGDGPSLDASLTQLQIVPVDVVRHSTLNLGNPSVCNCLLDRL